jgi:two-component system response regulator RegA
MIGPVLVVDDDRDVLHAARLALAAVAERIDTADTPDAAETILARGGYDVVLLDMNFAAGDQSGREGLSRFDSFCAFDPSLSIVLMTTYGGVSLAVDALKRGAKDFILKPWRNDRLVEVVTGAGEQTRIARRAASTFDLDGAEKAEIERALLHHGRNISRAAAALGMTRPALYRRMAKHGL